MTSMMQGLHVGWTEPHCQWHPGSPVRGKTMQQPAPLHTMPTRRWLNHNATSLLLEPVGFHNNDPVITTDPTARSGQRWLHPTADKIRHVILCGSRFTTGRVCSNHAQHPQEKHGDMSTDTDARMPALQAGLVPMLRNHTYQAPGP